MIFGGAWGPSYVSIMYGHICSRKSGSAGLEITSSWVGFKTRAVSKAVVAEAIAAEGGIARLMGAGSGNDRSVSACITSRPPCTREVDAGIGEPRVLAVLQASISISMVSMFKIKIRTSSDLTWSCYRRNEHGISCMISKLTVKFESLS